MYSYFIDILDMGGYGKYIWPCYGLLLSLISWQLFAAIKKNNLIKSEVKHNLWRETNGESKT